MRYVVHRRILTKLRLPHGRKSSAPLRRVTGVVNVGGSAFVFSYDAASVVSRTVFGLDSDSDGDGIPDALNITVR